MLVLNPDLILAFKNDTLLILYIILQGHIELYTCYNCDYHQCNSASI